MCELRRHIYSNSVDSYSLKKLVEKSFPSCQCELSSKLAAIVADPSLSPSLEDGVSPEHPCQLDNTPRVCNGHEVAIPIEATVEMLDVSEECLETLLCYLELRGKLKMRGSVRDTCTLKCYGGSRQVKALAWKVPAVAAAAARLKEKGRIHVNTCAVVLYRW